jgi:hypothetical protein
VTRGEHAGCYALVTAEIDGRWLFYVGEPPAGRGRYDEFHTVDFVDEVLADLGVEWLPPEEDARIEDEVFGLRAEWRASGLL